MAAGADLREGLGPQLADLEIEDLHPKRFMHRHLFDNPNADQGRRYSKGCVINLTTRWHGKAKVVLRSWQHLDPSGWVLNATPVRRIGPRGAVIAGLCLIQRFRIEHHGCSSGRGTCACLRREPPSRSESVGKHRRLARSTGRRFAHRSRPNHF